jgi:hypothetical protein
MLDHSTVWYVQYGFVATVLSDILHTNLTKNTGKNDSGILGNEVTLYVQLCWQVTNGCIHQIL